MCGEMREMDECDVQKVLVHRVVASEQAIAFLGDGWWPRAATREGDDMSKAFICKMWKIRNERPTVGGALLGAGAMFRLEKDAWSLIK